MELNQFKYSAFCHKVRMVLDAKNFSYKTIEITPGIGQLEIFRISGQKQLPVLVDGAKIISDSRAIIRYLEELKPEPKLLPSNPKDKGQVHLIENWADTTLARAASKTLLKAAAIDSELRFELLDQLPISLRKGIGHLPFKLFSNADNLLNQKETEDLLRSLKQIDTLLVSNQWLVGEQMTFADIAVAAQVSLLSFSGSLSKSLEGKGCPGFYDNPALENLFLWRDKLEERILKSQSK